jgi:hypothetical protein
MDDVERSGRQRIGDHVGLDNFDHLRIDAAQEPRIDVEGNHVPVPTDLTPKPTGYRTSPRPDLETAPTLLQPCGEHSAHGRRVVGQLEGAKATIRQLPCVRQGVLVRRHPSLPTIWSTPRGRHPGST